MDSITLPCAYQYLRAPDDSYVAVQGVVRVDDDARVTSRGATAAPPASWPSPRIR